MSVRYYQVVGDMGAEKSSEAYPLMALCDECVGNNVWVLILLVIYYKQ